MVRIFMPTWSVSNKCIFRFSEAVGCIMQPDVLAISLFLHIDNFFFLLMFKVVRTVLIPISIVIAAISVLFIRQRTM